jgi:chromosome segregation ATPase
MTTGRDDDGIGYGHLADRVRELGETLNAVVGELPVLVDAVARIDDEVDRLQSERTETGSALSRHDQQLREVSAAVRRLSTQVSWIEQHIRSSSGVQSVTLDRLDPELSALAASAEAGRRAADGLLSRFARTALESTVTTHRDALARRRAAADELIDACAALVDSEPDEPAHRKARSSYQRARDALVAAERQLAELGDEPRTGRVRLAEDDQVRARTRSTISDGEQAQSRLLTRLRTKLATAVGEGALLPAWLTTPLGPMPPADGAQRWMDVAAGLIAYRITYGVEDEHNALGELPEPVPDHRRRWHEDLRRGVRELRR